LSAVREDGEDDTQDGKDRKQAAPTLAEPAGSNRHCNSEDGTGEHVARQLGGRDDVGG
jgi:hypothetical protein